MAIIVKSKAISARNRWRGSTCYGCQFEKYQYPETFPGGLPANYYCFHSVGISAHGFCPSYDHRAAVSRPNIRVPERVEDGMWVYIQSEPGLWTVGFYAPGGVWHGDSDWPSREQAANRVHYLNGGSLGDDRGS